MKEVRHSIIPLPYDRPASSICDQIEREAEKYWDQGWVVIRAEPDGLLENLCLTFEREVKVDSLLTKDPNHRHATLNF